MGLSARLVAALAVTQTMAFGVVAAETLVGSNIDSRLIMAFDGTGDWAQAHMPDGWTAVAFPGGPMKGATTAMVLIDRHLARDAEGNPLDPSETRSSAIVALGTHPEKEGARLFVLRQYEIGTQGGAYGTSIPAAITHNQSLEGDDGKARMRREMWSFAPSTGGEMKVDLTYQAGTPVWTSGEMRPYSPVDTDFHRIYRYDQLVDVAMSEGLEKSLDGEIKIDCSIAELADHFDGTEELLAVLEVPMYVREVSLPY
ncbi:MAG: hypothetical protein QNI90_07080 [Dinoroseobacter sp.]|nr:hypothetical protein [Dinoroseobacter sp.]MDJ0993318.1 hypothetical protein [Dinoroseobacter sp.]